MWLIRSLLKHREHKSNHVVERKGLCTDLARAIIVGRASEAREFYGVNSQKNVLLLQKYLENGGIDSRSSFITRLGIFPECAQNWQNFKNNSRWAKKGPGSGHR